MNTSSSSDVQLIVFNASGPCLVKTDYVKQCTILKKIPHPKFPPPPPQSNGDVKLVKRQLLLFFFLVGGARRFEGHEDMTDK